MLSHDNKDYKQLDICIMLEYYFKITLRAITTKKN